MSTSVPIPQFCDAPKGIWTVLPFAGVSSLPLQFLDSTSTPSEPTLPKSTLWGIPYNGVNDGPNPNLRIMTLAPSDTALQGPVSEIAFGVRAKLFNNRLLHKINWKIRPVSCDTTSVNVGFYGENYLNVLNQANKAPLILTPKGPAFFTANAENCFSGSFTFTNASIFYVIVDANVFIELEVTYRVPKSKCPINYELFVPVPIKNSQHVIIATEEQVNTNPNLLVLRPATQELVDISQEMVTYLLASSVTLYFTVNTGTVTASSDVKGRLGAVPAPRQYTDIPLVPINVKNTPNDALVFLSNTDSISASDPINVLTRTTDGDNFVGIDLRSADGDNPLTVDGPITVNGTVQFTFSGENTNAGLPDGVFNTTTFVYNGNIALGTASGETIRVRPGVGGASLGTSFPLAAKKGDVKTVDFSFTFDSSQMEGNILQVSLTSLPNFIPGFDVAYGPDAVAIIKTLTVTFA